MDNSNRIKRDFLGMPYGTACNKLRKLLFYKYVEKALGGIKCWDCGDPIEDPDDLSIQHKDPWLHEDPALFWDTDNVAFAHKACNKTDRHSNRSKTHCPQNHPYSGDNLIITSRGWRLCRICTNESTKARMRRNRERKKS